MNWTDLSIKKTDSDYEKKIEMFVERRFQERIFNFMSGNTGDRKPGVHVSDLVYPCTRKAYYARLTPPNLDTKGAITLYTGIKVHEMPLSENCELTLEWNGIVGTIDEYENGLLIDKKTTRNVPKYYNRSRKEQVVSLRSHHLTQLEYYKVLLEENGYDVDEAGILYIDVNESEVWFGRAKFSRTSEEVKQEMIQRKTMLETFLNARKLPPFDNSIRWMCMGYCPYQQACALNRNPAEHLSDEYLNTRWTDINNMIEELNEPIEE